MQIGNLRLERRIARDHADLCGHAIGFSQVAGRTGCDNIFPCRHAAFGARDHVIESEIAMGATVLAGKTIAQKNVEAGKGRLADGLDKGLQRNDGRQSHLEAGTSHGRLVFGDDIDPIEEDRLDRILPRPERQGVITQGTKIRIEHQRRTCLRRNNRLEVSSHATPPLRPGAGFAPIRLVGNIARMTDL